MPGLALWAGHALVMVNLLERLGSPLRHRRPNSSLKPKQSTLAFEATVPTANGVQVPRCCIGSRCFEA